MFSPLFFAKPFSPDMSLSHEGRTVVIRGGRVIDPANRIDHNPADVVIRDGIIVAVATSAVPLDSSHESVDASGKVVCPGFVDLHTHLRFPGFPEKETVETGTRAAAAGGFTTICAMANTRPVVDRVETLQMVLDEIARYSVVKVFQLAAVTQALDGEVLTDMPALSDCGAVGFSDDGKPVMSASIMGRALEMSAHLGKPISAHEENRDIVGVGVAHHGEPARRHRLRTWPCEGETTMIVRDLEILRQSGGRLHLAHVSCADSIPPIREAKDQGLNVTAEVTPHHLCLTDALIDGHAGLSPRSSLTKVNPPLRGQEDVVALIEALKEGVIDAVATDHAPHAEADKSCDFESAAFGLTGLEPALPMVLDLVRRGRIPLATAIERLTAGPANAFDLKAGTLTPGTPADICVFDPDAVWTMRPETMRSMGKNSPLLGAELRGKVVCTLVDGRIVHRS